MHRLGRFRHEMGLDRMLASDSDALSQEVSPCGGFGAECRQMTVMHCLSSFCHVMGCRQLT
jgi:hypothetical protein